MINAHRSMRDLAPDAQARKALAHILSRVREDSRVGFYLGYGTESFALATEALASLTGEEVLKVRKTYEPLSPADPAVAQPSKAPCLDNYETKTLEAVAVHLRKESGRTELMAGTVCDQCGYERHQVADQLDTWATSLNSIAYRKGGA